MLEKIMRMLRDIGGGRKSGGLPAGDRIRDTIEGSLDDGMNFSVWDVKKTLMRKAIPGGFSARSEICHTYSMAAGIWKRRRCG